MAEVLCMPEFPLDLGDGYTAFALERSLDSLEYIGWVLGPDGKGSAVRFSHADILQKSARQVMSVVKVRYHEAKTMLSQEKPND